MKYSFMSFSCPDLSLDAMLELAGRLGYDAIEPRIGSGHKHGIELETSHQERTLIKDKVAAGSIELCCLATSCNYSNPETRDEMIDQTLKAIELAADVGCRKIRVFGGDIPAGISRTQAIDSLAGSLKKVAVSAEGKNVVVCLETHDAWCEPDHVVAVMNLVDSTNVAVNWDIMHPVRRCGRTIDYTFNRLQKWIRHCHIHDGAWFGEDLKITLTPIGQGMVDHKRALELLIKAGYDGAVSGEWIKWAGSPYEEHLPRELALLKKIEKEVNKTLF